MKATQVPQPKLLLEWLTTLLGIPGILLFCALQIANYMGSSCFLDKVYPVLYHSIGFLER